MKKPHRVAVPLSDEVYAVVQWLAELENRTPANFLGHIIDERFRDVLHPSDDGVVVHHCGKDAA